jgi:hypothetical protein
MMAHMYQNIGRFQGEGYYVTEDVWRDVEEFKLYFTPIENPQPAYFDKC